MSKDIKLMTNSPILHKKQVLDHNLIQVIRAFLIEEIDVEPKLANGESFEAPIIEEEEKKEPKNDKIKEPVTFSDFYYSAVQGYKRLFQNWQSGSPVDMPKLREVLHTFFEKAVHSPRDTFKIHHYSSKDDYLFHHAVAVGALSALLAEKLKFPKGDWMQIGFAGALADSGMAKIDPKILNKKERLTNREFAEVKRHPEYSYTMLQQVSVIKDSVRKGVLQHHEREDGSGYPQGLKSDALHPYGKIIAVSDAFHAMTSERNYQSKQSPFKVLEIILRDSFGKFDVKVVQALTSLLTSFSTGTLVKLSDYTIGEIIFIEQNYPTRPMIKLEDGNIIQLSKRNDLFIEDILD